MAKLYFRYGAVGSAKTLNLLAVAHQYERQGKRVLVLKPAFDTRFSAVEIVSRSGLKRSADRVLGEGEIPPADSAAEVDCVLVDEAQVLTQAQVETLRDWTLALGVPVICYGLRTDFRSRLFEGSQRLLELADTIEEIKTTCAWCNRKATQNLKYVDGRASLDGSVRRLGSEERYQAVCYRHYREQLALSESVDGLSTGEASVAHGGARV